MDTLRILMCGSRISRLTTLLVLLTLPAWAQAVTTFAVQTNIDMNVNGGFMDADSTFEGPGISINAQGNYSCAYCFFGSSLAPGSSLAAGSLFVDFGFGSATLTLGGQQINCELSNNCALQGTDITAPGSFTLPTNDQTFTITMPAAIGQISGLTGLNGPPSLPFNIRGGPGELTLDFQFIDQFGAYQFGGGTFSTPEPGTRDLMMAAFLAGIIGVVLKSRKLPARLH